MVKVTPYEKKETGSCTGQIKAMLEKAPKNFFVNLPKLDMYEKVQTDSNEPVSTSLYGEVNCYHNAHTTRNGKNTCSNNKLNYSQSL